MQVDPTWGFSIVAEVVGRDMLSARVSVSVVRTEATEDAQPCESHHLLHRTGNTSFETTNGLIERIHGVLCIPAVRLCFGLVLF